MTRTIDATEGLVKLPCINGLPLAAADEDLSPQDLRQRACTELLRQAAQAAGLLRADDGPAEHGAISAHAEAAIEAWLAQQLPPIVPDDLACQRHFDAHAARYAQGEQVQARHVLFAVTPGVDIQALRHRAEACLLQLRCTPEPGETADGRFAQVAAETSNCPTGRMGGYLGWLQVADCAPEFARELFGRTEVGVLPRLVHSRFGLHVVEVLARRPGRVPSLQQVRGAVEQALVQQHFATGLRRLLQQLADAADLQGVNLDDSTAAQGA